MVNHNLEYVKILYGENSKQYELCKYLDYIKNLLLENNYLILIKECKQEFIEIKITIKNNCIEILKINKHKKNRYIKQKLIKKYNIIDFNYSICEVVNHHCYNYLLDGYKITNGKEIKNCIN